MRLELTLEDLIYNLTWLRILTDDKREPDMQKWDSELCWTPVQAMYLHAKLEPPVTNNVPLACQVIYAWYVLRGFLSPKEWHELNPLTKEIRKERRKPKQPTGRKAWSTKVIWISLEAGCTCYKAAIDYLLKDNHAIIDIDGKLAPPDHEPGRPVTFDTFSNNFTKQRNVLHDNQFTV